MQGNGRIYKRGKRWWIAYYAPQDGRSVEMREAGGDTEKEARRLLKARLDEITVHKSGLRKFSGPKQERLTVAELLQSFEQDCEIRGLKSLAQVRSHLKHIRSHFGVYRALSVTPDRIREYMSRRKQAGAANATINRELEGLQRAFALAVDSGQLNVVPKIPSLPEHNARQGFFERAEFYAVLERISNRNVADFLEWFYWTGMRPGEIRSLTWKGFDRETWTLRLHAKDAKSGHGRVIGLEGPLQEIVKRRLASRVFGCDLIFHRNGKPIGTFGKQWKTACKLAGVSEKIPYDLRRTAVRNMVRAGVPEKVAMSISGHRTRQVFDRYNIVSENDLREAISKTVDYVGSLPLNRGLVPMPANRPLRKPSSIFRKCPI